MSSKQADLLIVPGPSSSSDSPCPPAKKKQALSFLFDEEVDVTTAVPAISLSEQVHTEISMYKLEPRLQPTADPLLFWKRNSGKYPMLAKCSRIFLCVQAATSVASERVFSTAGDIVTATRSCLDADHVDRLVFLKKNLDDDKDIHRVLQNL